MSDADLIIIGFGMGRAPHDARLAPTDLRILLVEKGERLKLSTADRDTNAIFGKAHFRPKEEWLEDEAQPFNPSSYCNVGGNSKFYGAVLLRFCREDFSPLRHMGGTMSGWQIAYGSLERWYQQIQHLFVVLGTLGEDLTEPPHSGSYDHTPVADEPTIADLPRLLHKTGYLIILSRPCSHCTRSYQCGTARMGSDLMTSVVDSFVRSHDHRNLFILDASILPTSAAVDSAFSIAALALRSGLHITETEFSQ